MSPSSWQLHRMTEIAAPDNSRSANVVEFAFRWACLARRQRGVVAIERRAIGAHILKIVAHVAEDMRMVLWRQRTHAHEFLGADLDGLNA